MNQTNAVGRCVLESLEPRMLLSGDFHPSLGAYEITAPPMVDASGMVVQLGKGAARRVRYVDSDGTAVSVGLGRGWASLELTGSNLSWSVKRGTVHVEGDGVELADILLRETSFASRLTIRTNRGGDGLSTLGGLFGSTPLGGFNAGKTDLVGEGIVLSGEGTIGTLKVHDLTNGADVILPSTQGRGVRIKAGRIGDGSDVRVGSRIRKLRAEEWLDSDPDEDLVAPQMDRLWVQGDFYAEVLLTGADSGRTLGGGRIGGDLIGSDWSIFGPKGRLVVKGRTLVGPGLPVSSAGDVSLSDVKQLAEASNALGWDLYHALSAEAGAGNMVFSPLSVSTALAMAYAGAGGATAAQIAEVGRFGVEGDAVHAGMGELIDRVGGSGKADVFNGVWAQDTGGAQLRYAELVRQYYDAELGTMDFARSPGGARTSINRQVKNLTGGAISSLFGPGSIDASTSLALASTVGWNAEWSDAFDTDDTGDWHFTSLDGGRKRVSMMSQLENHTYFETDNYKAVALSAEGDQRVYIILPEEGTFEQVESQLSERMIDQIDGGGSYRIDLKIPRFKAEASANLRPALQTMGLSDAFDAESADFSGIDAGGSGGLFLKAVPHGAAIEMTEAGANGSTSTSASGSLSVVGGVKLWNYWADRHGDAARRQFIADRPFIYVVRDCSTGSTLFVGRVTDAAGEGFKSTPTGAAPPPVYPLNTSSRPQQDIPEGVESGILKISTGHYGVSSDLINIGGSTDGNLNYDELVGRGSVISLSGSLSVSPGIMLVGYGGGEVVDLSALDVGPITDTFD